MPTKFLSKGKMFNSGVVILTVVAVALCAPPTSKKTLHPLPDGRIVGGDDANIEDYPYQLSLLYDGHHTCGASIIDKKWAITAAHCTDELPDSSFTVRAASSYLETDGQLINVKHVHQHPGFHVSDMDFDISILELEEDIQFTKGAAPIALVGINARLGAEDEAVVTGWGLLEQGDRDLSTRLQVVKVPIVSKEACARAYGESMITDRMICAGVTEGGRDSCQGDSGGPFVVNGKLAGIVSWGYGCAEPRTPGVYTNIAAVREFVTEITKL